MSRGGGSFQSETEQIRSKETSTNCLLAKHRCIGEKEREAGTPRVAERGSHQSPQHKEAEARARTYTNTHTSALASSCRRCLVRSRLLHNGCCTSLTPLVLFKKQCPKVALHPQEQTLTFVPRAVKDGANIKGKTTGCLFWASPLVPVSLCDVLSSFFLFFSFRWGVWGDQNCDVDQPPPDSHRI